VRNLFDITILTDLNALSIIVRIILSLLIGGILGIERERKRQPAGFRTYMLVCLGATLAMMTNQYVLEQFGGGDMTRLGAQVISGIGFLGAGTIIVTRNSQVRGLTTAAGLWTAACLGLAIGIGFYEGAILVGFTVYLIMTVFQKVDNWLVNNSKHLNLYLSFETIEYMNRFLEFCQKENLIVRNMELGKNKAQLEEGVFVIITLKSTKRMYHPDVVKKISEQKGLRHVEEL